MTGMVATSLETCAHCGDKVSTRGRKPKKLGRRYCTKTECRQAKAKALRKVTPKPPPRKAPTVCAGCKDESDPLPERNWRNGDELGRYHRRNACLRVRAEIRQSVDGAALLEARQRIKFLEETAAVLLAMSGEARVQCPECKLIDAVEGYGHLTEYKSEAEPAQPCRGTLEERGRGLSVDWGYIFAVIWPGEKIYGDGY